MGELDVGGIPVGTPDKLEGMLTDRDILFRHHIWQAAGPFDYGVHADQHR